MDDALRMAFEEGEMGQGKLNVEALRTNLNQQASVLPVTNVAVDDVVLASFDELLGDSTGVWQ